MLSLQHNLMNLLYVIKGLAESHLCRADEKRFEDCQDALKHARKVLNLIYKKSDQAMGIARHMRLAFQDAEVRNTALAYSSLEEVWDEMICLFVKRYSLKNFEIIRHIPKEFPSLRCVREDLSEILYHLIRNAFQAMSMAAMLPGKTGCLADKFAAAGKLIIRANLEMTEDGSPLAVIVLADTGPGISEETLGRIFDPFFSTKPPHKGNGLGLCLVKSLVKRNSGKISVSSFKGYGTTFTLTFPATKTHEPQVLVSMHQ